MCDLEIDECKGCVCKIMVPGCKGFWSFFTDDTVIASSVWSCGHEYGVKNVKVIDSSGKLLTVFSR